MESKRSKRYQLSSNFFEQFKKSHYLKIMWFWKKKKKKKPLTKAVVTNFRQHGLLEPPITFALIWRLLMMLSIWFYHMTFEQNITHVSKRVATKFEHQEDRKAHFQFRLIRRISMLWSQDHMTSVKCCYFLSASDIITKLRR